MAHDGSEGLSPDGWLPDRISVGVLTRAFPPELVDEVIEVTGTREQRRRLLPARLMVYFVLALWLFRGRNCGYGQVMAKLADGLYQQRRGADLLAGRLGRVAGWMPGGPAVVAAEHLLLHRAAASSARARSGCCSSRWRGRPGRRGAGGVLLRDAGRSMDGSVTDVPDSEKNAAFFGLPSNQSRDGAFPQARWVAAAESGTGSLLGAAIGRYTGRRAGPGRGTCGGCFGPGMLVLADRKFLSWSARPRLPRDGRAYPVARFGQLHAEAGEGPAGRHLPGGTEAAPQGRRSRRSRCGSSSTPCIPSGSSRGLEESSEVFCLVTDLLNPEEYPALDLACCYPRRWGCETVIGHHKTDMGEGQPVLRSGDPEGVMQEMWALFAVYQAICRIVGLARGRGGHSPGQDQLPARPGRRDRYHRGFPPLSRRTSRSPRSC